MEERGKAMMKMDQEKRKKEKKQAKEKEGEEKDEDNEDENDEEEKEEATAADPQGISYRTCSECGKAPSLFLLHTYTYIAAHSHYAYLHMIHTCCSCMLRMAALRLRSCLAWRKTTRSSCIVWAIRFLHSSARSFSVHESGRERE